MSRKDYKQWSKEQRIKEWGEDPSKPNILTKLIWYTFILTLGVATGATLMGLVWLML